MAYLEHLPCWRVAFGPDIGKAYALDTKSLAEVSLLFRESRLNVDGEGVKRLPKRDREILQDLREAAFEFDELDEIAIEKILGKSAAKKETNSSC